MPQTNRDALKVTLSCTLAAVLLGERAEWCKAVYVPRSVCVEGVRGRPSFLLLLHRQRNRVI